MAVREINQAEFDSVVLGSKKPVFIDFWATWCGPCRMLSPIVEELSKEHPEVLFVKVNVDENMNLAVEYNINAIPALMVIKDGEIAAQSVGYQDKAALEALLA